MNYLNSRDSGAPVYYTKSSPSFLMIKKYLILTFSLLVFVKCNENRNFLLSFFVFIKLKMGNTLDFISMLY